MKEDRAIFTIVTKSYLAYARALSAQLRAFQPGTPFFVFLADRPDNCFRPQDEPFPIVLLESFAPAPLLRTMTGYYTAYELCNALKPFAHLYLSRLEGMRQWVYLDSDIYVTGSLDPVFAELGEGSLLLTPHLLQVEVVPRLEKLEVILLRTGIYNGGCLAVNKSAESFEFLNWWRERLTWNCLNNAPGLEADQSWLNFVPSLFASSKLSRDPAVNIAYWNIHERPLEMRAENGCSVGGRAVTFFHFSGWDWRDPEVPSRHLAVELGSSKAAWLRAARDYSALLISSGVEACQPWPYSFATAENGAELTPPMRRNYLAWLREQGDSAGSVSLFANPEKFAEVKPAALSLRQATRLWLEAMKRSVLGR